MATIVLIAALLGSLLREGSAALLLKAAFLSMAAPVAGWFLLGMGILAAARRFRRLLPLCFALLLSFAFTGGTNPRGLFLGTVPGLFGMALLAGMGTEEFRRAIPAESWYGFRFLPRLAVALLFIAPVILGSSFSHSTWMLPGLARFASGPNGFEWGEWYDERREIFFPYGGAEERSRELFRLLARRSEEPEILLLDPVAYGTAMVWRIQRDRAFETDRVVRCLAPEEQLPAVRRYAAEGRRVLLGGIDPRYFAVFDLGRTGELRPRGKVVEWIPYETTGGGKRLVSGTRSLGIQET